MERSFEVKNVTILLQITFILNALEEIVARSIQVLSTTKRVKLIFAIRSTSLFDSFLFTIRDILSSTRRACPYLEIQVEIYETRIVVTSPLSPPLSAGTPRTGGTYIASTPRTGALSATTPRAFLPQKNEYICQGIRIIRGKRPNLVTCLNHSLNDTIPQSQGKTEMGGGVALITCGPVGLIDDVSEDTIHEK